MLIVHTKTFDPIERLLAVTEVVFVDDRFALPAFTDQVPLPIEGVLATRLAELEQTV